MSSGVHLSKAPIVEGLIDIRVKPASAFKPEDLLAIRDLIHEQYPSHKEALRLQASFEFNEGEGAEQSVKTQKVGYRFDSADGHYVLQVQRGGFTLSRLKPYETWENLFAEARRLWVHYLNVAQPQAVTRVATRYINRIELDAAQLDFDDYLAAPPNVPKRLPQLIGEFLTRIVLTDKDTGASIVLTQALEPMNLASNTVPVVIDIDVFKEVALAVDSEEYWQLLSEFRHLKNNAFFGSITDKTLELLK